MSHGTFLKSTREDVLKMLELKKQGLRLAEIARNVKKNHATVLYWFRKVGLNNIFVDNFEPKSAIMNIDIYKKEEAKKIMVCNFCKGKRNKKWNKTKWCCIGAWHEANKKHKNYLYW